MGVKNETITVSGLVAYCDGCGIRGPETAYDNHDDLFEQLVMDGWEEDDGPLLCDTCVAKAKRGGT